MQIQLKVLNYLTNNILTLKVIIFVSLNKIINCYEKNISTFKKKEIK